MTQPVSTKNSSNGTATATSSLRLTDGGERIMQGIALQARRYSSRSARQAHAVAAATQGFDRLERVVRIELAPQAPHQHFDHIAVPIEVLIVETLGEFRLGDHLSGTQHEVFENTVFEAGQFDPLATYADGLR